MNDNEFVDEYLFDCSFSVIHIVGNIGILVLLKSENKMDRAISHFNFNSKHHDKCQFALKFKIQLITISIFFIRSYKKMLTLPTLFPRLLYSFESPKLTIYFAIDVFKIRGESIIFFTRRC